jgi:polysaccharide biosynthesis transport protein
VTTAAAPELRDYLSLVWRRAFSIILVTGVVLAAGTYYSHRQESRYASSSQVLVRPVNLSPAEAASPRDVNMEDERRVATSAEVSAIAADDLATSGSAQAGVSVSNEPGTNVLTFRSTSTDPVAAQATAQAYADAYLQFRRDLVLDDLRAASEPLEQRIAQLDQELDDLQAQILAADEDVRTTLQIRFNSLFSQRSFLEQRLNELILPENLQVGRVLQSAFLPTSPSSPDHSRTARFALVAGLALGLVQAFVRDRLDDRVRTRSGFETDLAAPVLAVIPARPPRALNGRGSASAITGNGRAVATMAPDGADDAYRALAANLLGALGHDQMQSITVTTSCAPLAKRRAAGNLSVILARSGMRTVLVSADDRDHGPYDPPARGPGLAGVARGELTALAALEPTTVPGLRVLPSGAGFGAPPPLLAPKVVEAVLESLRRDVDIVVIDAPPLLSNPEALTLVVMTDVVLLVEDMTATSSALDRARDLLERLDATVIGVAVDTRTAHPVWGRRRDQTHPWPAELIPAIGPTRPT